MKHVHSAACWPCNIVSGPLTFAELTAANQKRMVSATGFNHPSGLWRPTDWTNAVAGEVGEACNLSKKLSRHDDGLRGDIKPEDKDREVMKQRLLKELADVITYANLAIAELGGNSDVVVRQAFNDKSIEIGSEVFI